MKGQSVNAGECWPKRVQFQPAPYWFTPNSQQCIAEILAQRALPKPDTEHRAGKLGAAIFIERFAIERETQLLAAALVVTSVASSNAASHSVLFVGRCTVTISFVGLGNTMHSYTYTTNS